MNKQMGLRTFILNGEKGEIPEKIKVLFVELGVFENYQISDPEYNLDKENFIKLFQDKLSSYFIFEDDLTYASNLKKEGIEFYNFMIDFLYRFSWNFKSNYIYTINSKIEKIHNTLKALGTFPNYKTYVDQIDKSKLFLSSPDDITDNKKFIISYFLNFELTKETQQFIESTLNMLNMYYSNIEIISSKLTELKQSCQKTTTILKSTTNDHFIKEIYDFLFVGRSRIVLKLEAIASKKGYFPMNSESSVIKFKSQIMTDLYSMDIEDLKETFMKVSTSTIDQKFSSVYKPMISKNFKYEIINNLMYTDNNINAFIKKIKLIDWEVEEIIPLTVGIETKKTNLQLYFEFILNNCIPLILTYSYKDILYKGVFKWLNKYFMYLNNVINFYIFKTRGYAQLKNKIGENPAILNSVSNVRIDSTKFNPEYDCNHLFKIETLLPIIESFLRLTRPYIHLTDDIKPKEEIDKKMAEQEEQEIERAKKTGLKHKEIKTLYSIKKYEEDKIKEEKEEKEKEKDTQLIKLTRELTDIFKKNDIEIESVSDMVRVVDQVFFKKAQLQEWYIKNWWDITSENKDNDSRNTDQDVKEKLREIIETANAPNHFEKATLVEEEYTIVFNYSNTAEDNMIYFYVPEIEKTLKINFNINIKDLYKMQIDKLNIHIANKFEIFLTKPIFKPFYEKYKNQWISFLWWYFNIYFEGKQRSNANIGQPENIGQIENNAELVACKTRETECNTKLSTLQKEFDELTKLKKIEMGELESTLKDATHDIRLVEKKINGIDDQIESNTKQIEQQIKSSTDETDKKQKEKIMALQAKNIELGKEKDDYFAILKRCEAKESAIEKELGTCKSDNENFKIILKNHIDELTDLNKKEHASIQQIASLDKENIEILVKVQEINKSLEINEIKTKKLIDQNSELQAQIQNAAETYALAHVKDPAANVDHENYLKDLAQNKEKEESITDAIKELTTTKEVLIKETKMHTKEIMNNMQNADNIKAQIDSLTRKSKKIADELNTQKDLYANSRKKGEVSKKTSTIGKPPIVQIPPVFENSPSIHKENPIWMSNHENVNAITHIIIYSIVNAHLLNSKIPRDQYKLIQHLFPYTPTPYQLIHLLDTNNKGFSLNYCLYYVLISDILKKNKEEYITYIISKPNITPYIQFKPRGLTVLDIAAATSKENNSWILQMLVKHPRFDINNEYPIHNGSPQTFPYSRPLIEAIKNRDGLTPLYASIILTNTSCNIYLPDSNGLTPIDHIVDMPNNKTYESREFINKLFRVLIQFNKEHGKHRYKIFEKSKNITYNKIFETWQLSEILLNTDNNLFQHAYREYYKNNPFKLAELPNYVIKQGGTRRKQYARRRTKRRRMIQRTSRTKHRSKPTRGRLRKRGKKTKRTVIQG